MESNLFVKVKKNDLICKEGDLTRDLYMIIEGKLLICNRNNRMVTPLAYLEKDSYFGEFSFFDGQKRSADVIALEDSTLMKIPLAELKKQFPRWLLIVAKNMTKKLRLMDDVIRKKGIKKNKQDHIKPLSIEEQRHYFEIITKS
jgi:CRP/FNR family transcriptional regulator, cyclic AMP receptor protein